MTPHELMGRALELAARAQGLTRPNPCVGAVIVSAGGDILGEGFHRRAGQPHAEIDALRDASQAGRDVRGATMYVTLEPCNHQGRTGPCSEALIAAGIARAVVAMRDPHAAARGGVEILQAAGVSVQVGLRGVEAALINPAFVTFHGLGRPLVTLKWAMTLDGCTAVPGGDSKWITAEEARAEVHRRRSTQDAVLAGIETVLRDDARLTARVDNPAGPPLVRIVLDSALRLTPDARFLTEGGDSPALVICCDDARVDLEEPLRRAGAEVLRVARGPRGVSLADVMFHLRAREIQSLTVEGGRAVAGSFLEAGLVDRVEAWIAPRLAGGGPAALGPIALPTPNAEMSQALDLSNPTLQAFGRDWLIEGWLTDHLFKGG